MYCLLCSRDLENDLSHQALPDEVLLHALDRERRWVGFVRPTAAREIRSAVLLWRGDGRRLPSATSSPCSSPVLSTPPLLMWLVTTLTPSHVHALSVLQVETHRLPFGDHIRSGPQHHRCWRRDAFAPEEHAPSLRGDPHTGGFLHPYCPRFVSGSHPSIGHRDARQHLSLPPGPKGLFVATHWFIFGNTRANWRSPGIPPPGMHFWDATAFKAPVHATLKQQKNQCPNRLMVRTSRCGHGQPRFDSG